MGQILMIRKKANYKRSVTILLQVILICLSSSIFSQNFQSSNLPIFVINTNGGTIANEPKILADLDVIYNGPGQLNKLTDTLKHFRGRIGVEFRGSSSQDLSPKKPMGFETRKEDGETNLNVSLLGLPEENDWILLAPYSDKSLMRDVLIHHLAAQIMPYSSRARFCEVVVNGQYMGVYVLMEKIKRDKQRVNIRDLAPEDNSGDKLTGGYILKIDKTSGSTPQGGFNSNYDSGNGFPPRRTYYQYEHPEANVLTIEQKNYIRNLINSFEASFLQPNYKHPTEGYRKYVDEESLIHFMILNELANNVDGYRLSTFLYKDADSKNKKIKFGPVWDFNLGFGNANYCSGGASDVLAMDFNLRCPNDGWQIPFYWSYLFQDSLYATNLSKRWTDLRRNILSEQVILNAIDSMSLLLNESQQRNFQRWNVLSLYVWPNLYVGGSYENEIQYLKTWVKKRLTYLDGVFKQITLPVYSPDKYFEPIVFPNPVVQDEEVTFKYYVHDYDQISIEVFDIMGRSMYLFKDGPHLNGINQIKSQNLKLPGGLYYYSIYVTGHKGIFRTGKIIVR